MAFKNVLDDTSTTVSASTPGWTVDLREHTTLRLASVGVPVRFKVCASSTVGGDTGAVKLLDSGGNAVLTCLINNTAATTDVEGDWYWTDGYLPATLAKYDVHYGGNTLGALTVFSAAPYEIDWTTDPVTGVAEMTLGAMTVSATVPFSGDLSSTLGALSVASTGTVDVAGASSMTLGALTVASTGLVSAPALAAYQAVGSVVHATGTNVVWPTHAVNDYGILVVVQTHAVSAGDPGAATLSTASGFSAISTASTFFSNGARTARITLFELRASSTSMSAPQVAATGSAHTTSAYIITFRGCTTSGSAVDVISTSGAANVVSITGATTSGTNEVVLIALGACPGADTSMASWTNSDLASITERVDDSNAGVGNGRALIAGTTGDKAAAGAYGATTATIGTGPWAAVTIALKP